MARYNRILAALDSGDTRIDVAHRALSIARDNEAEVLFAHVIDATELVEARADIADYLAPCQRAIEGMLAGQLAALAQSERIAAVDIEVGHGIVNDVLTDIAGELKPDLVICGVRGRSGIKLALLGSVSSYLVRHMDCDVLVVRPKKPAAEEA